jgi:nitrogen fixation/metabolism regulation signal transduction histidine kinase
LEKINIVKISILTKLLLLVATLSVIPVLLASIISHSYFKKLENLAIQQIQEGTTFATQATKDSLNTLGRQIIKNRALGTAILVDLYLKENPRLTAKDLTQDKEFQKLGVLPVGDKGYTAVVTSDDATFIAHPSTVFLNKSPYENPALQAPIYAGFWKVIDDVTKNQKESEGYYNWVEPDKTISDKYMYVALTQGKTADGKRLATAATTYINEFNQPAEKLNADLSTKYDETVNEIAGLEKQIVFTRIGVVTLLLLVVIGLSIFFSRKITNPIKKLTEGAKLIAFGNIESTLPEIKTGDEIEELAIALEAMRKSITTQTKELLELKGSLEKKVEERTKEVAEAKQALEGKLGETERLNKVMIDRELKMVELKNELAKLKGETPIL